MCLKIIYHKHNILSIVSKHMVNQKTNVDKHIIIILLCDIYDVSCNIHNVLY